MTSVSNHVFASAGSYLPQIGPQSLHSVLVVTGLGFLLGVRHSTDADHVVALSTIVSKQRTVKAAALIGALWGVGHTVTIFIVGTLIILCNIRIPARLGLAMEFSVAVMLVVLGLGNFTGFTQWLSRRCTSLYEDSAGNSSVEPRLRRTPVLERVYARLGMFHTLRPLFVGLVHGLAGSAAVALMVLSTIRSPLWATVYLLIFGLGTVAGMMLMTTSVAVPLIRQKSRFARVNQYLVVTSGVVSLVFGCFLMYQLGFVGGLFSQHPHWTPQ